MFRICRTKLPKKKARLGVKTFQPGHCLNMAQFNYTIDVEHGPGLKRLLWQLKSVQAIAMFSGLVGGMLAYAVMRALGM